MRARGVTKGVCEREIIRITSQERTTSARADRDRHRTRGDSASPRDTREAVSGEGSGDASGQPFQGERSGPGRETDSRDGDG